VHAELWLVRSGVVAQVAPVPSDLEVDGADVKVELPAGVGGKVALVAFQLFGNLRFSSRLEWNSTMSLIRTISTKLHLKYVLDT
jgi:hypothetical protein